MAFVFATANPNERGQSGLQVAQSGTQPPYLQVGQQTSQSGQCEFGLNSPFASQKLVPLV